MGCKPIAFANVWDESSLVKLSDLNRKKMLLLPFDFIHSLNELLRCTGDSFQSALDNGKLMCRAVWTTKKPIAKLGHKHWSNLACEHVRPRSNPSLRICV